MALSTCVVASRAPRRFIGWQTFFDFGVWMRGGEAQ